jgi:Dimethyladenosine transferase (rRNA methylation)
MRSHQPRKQFAQHWLRSEKALNKIVKSALLSPSDCLLEIGPGTGILTSQLLSVARSVVAVEIDRDLSQNLVKRFGNRDNFFITRRRYSHPRY